MLGFISGVNGRTSRAAATGPANSVLPVITGTATEYQTLSVSDGTWSGSGSITYAYQWKRGGVNIAGATNSSYELTFDDIGALITCAVTATDSTGSATATSAATSAVVNYLSSLSRAVHFSAIDSAVTESGGKVTAISDISGNGNNLALSSGATNECTYSAAHAAANGKPAFVFADSSHDTHFRVPSNITAQDFFFVCQYRSGTETTFAGNNALLGGSGSFGSKRIAGNTSQNDWLSSSHFADKSSKNGAAAVDGPLPMTFDVYHFTAVSGSAETDQFYFFGGAATPTGWQGHVCEAVGLASAPDADTKAKILKHLRNKYSIPTYELNALFVGQSLLNRGFTFHSGAGKTAFINEAKALGFTNVNALNGAHDSLAVVYQADSGSGAYLNSTNDGEGAAFTSYTVAAVDGAAPLGIGWSDIDIVFYMIGNTDRLAVQNAVITEAQHKAGYKKLIDLVKARAPNALHVSVPNIGELSLTTNAQHEAWSAIKRAQWEVMNENAYVLESANMSDLTRADTQHPDQAGYELLFARMARMAAHYLGMGAPNNPLGAEIASATYNVAADSVTVTVSHDDGTDFTVSDAGGFWVYVNGVYAKPTSVTRNSATSFTLSGGLSIAPGDTVTLSWASGTQDDMTIADIFLDNATKKCPLRSRFGLSVTEG